MNSYNLVSDLVYDQGLRSGFRWNVPSCSQTQTYFTF